MLDNRTWMDRPADSAWPKVLALAATFAVLVAGGLIALFAAIAPIIVRLPFHGAGQ